LVPLIFVSQLPPPRISTDCPRLLPLLLVPAPMTHWTSLILFPPLPCPLNLVIKHLSFLLPSPHAVPIPCTSFLSIVKNDGSTGAVPINTAFCIPSGLPLTVGVLLLLVQLAHDPQDFQTSPGSPFPWTVTACGFTAAYF